MSRYYSDPEMLEQQKPNSACGNFVRYTWKTITCLFSHITLISMVVCYCLLGGYTFMRLEQENERNVKTGIKFIRNNVTDRLWNLTTKGSYYLEEQMFTENAIRELRNFEMALLKAITKDGWDGDENPATLQWSFPGALFYSIIVITTIGYGHIAPKTQLGKVVTIFYAILGIPLMLLCLSNIGDIMATSFRFIYWRVCCYVCTKKPKRGKLSRNSRGGTIRTQGRSSLRSRTASIKRSIRTSTRSADSGFALSDVMMSSHSDTELRYHDERSSTTRHKRGQSLPRMQSSQRSRHSDDVAPSTRRQTNAVAKLPARGGSLDRRRLPKPLELDSVGFDKAPVYCNKYVVEQNELINHVPGITDRRAISVPKHFLEPPRIPSPSSSQDEQKSQRKRPQYSPSPRIMSPLGYGHRSKYLDDPPSDDDYEDYYQSEKTRIKPVPIWLCVFLVISYIIVGAYLFHRWEQWSYLNAAYFCFITLTTIGFGDYVPAAKENKEEYHKNIAFCSLYLLFGISLLAMSFNLVQEEVIANVKKVAKTLGIIKSEDSEEEED